MTAAREAEVTFPGKLVLICVGLAIVWLLLPPRRRRGCP